MLPLTPADSVYETEPTDDRSDQIAALERSIAEKRKHAIEHRSALGIEREWVECEDAYEGVDDANRFEERPVSARLVKPASSDGGSLGVRHRRGTRSTVFLNITRPYADAASSRVADMLVPTDDRNFSILPTPIPDLVIDPRQTLEPTYYAQLFGDLQAQREEAYRKAQSAQTRVDDWLTECQFHAEVRKVIEDCTRLGTGVLKGPYPTKRTRNAVSSVQGRVVLERRTEIIPESRRIDPWNLFPDPSCGEEIHNGSFLFERDYLSTKQVRELMGQPGYRIDTIQAILSEGPSRTNVSQDARRSLDDERYEVWYFSGQVSLDDFVALENGYEAEHDAGPFINVLCTMINDRIIKATESYLESGDFCYDLVTWQRRVGMPWGIGIVKQVSVPQRMVNGGVRNMSDNAALSSAPQIVRMRGVVDPADGVDEIVPRKVWWCDPNSSVDDIRKAFMAIEIPTMQQELLNIIQFALQMAENVTGMPMLMQGNQGAAPDTVGGMELLNSNATSVLKRIAKNFDDCITTPHIRRYYEWILLYGADEEKGDFIIDARGSSSLVDRDIQRRAILGMGQLVLNPVFGVDPELWFEEAMRANRIDPSRLKLSDRKKMQLQQQAALQAQAQAQAVAQQQAAAEQERIAQQVQEHQKLVVQAAIKDAEFKKDIVVAKIAHAAKNPATAKDPAPAKPVSVAGGLVTAPPGPPNQDTGVIRASLGEYVLPAETVRALGGAAALDALVQKTSGQPASRETAAPTSSDLLKRFPGFDDGGFVGGDGGGFSDAGSFLDAGDDGSWGNDFGASVDPSQSDVTGTGWVMGGNDFGSALDAGGYDTWGNDFGASVDPSQSTTPNVSATTMGYVNADPIAPSTWASSVIPTSNNMLGDMVAEPTAVSGLASTATASGDGVLRTAIAEPTAAPTPGDGAPGSQDPMVLAQNMYAQNDNGTMSDGSQAQNSTNAGGVTLPGLTDIARDISQGMPVTQLIAKYGPVYGPGFGLMLVADPPVAAAGGAVWAAGQVFNAGGSLQDMIRAAAQSALPTAMLGSIGKRGQ